MPVGSVKWFNSAKGYGFIAQDDGKDDVFVHIAVVQYNGMKSLEPGQRLAFDIEDNPAKAGKRKPQRMAINLRIAP
jgi:cold shock protein